MARPGRSQWALSSKCAAARSDTCSLMLDTYLQQEGIEASPEAQSAPLAQYRLQALLQQALMSCKCMPGTKSLGCLPVQHALAAVERKCLPLSSCCSNLLHDTDPACQVLDCYAALS